jgi:hypothetical protein
MTDTNPPLTAEMAERTTEGERIDLPKLTPGDALKVRAVLVKAGKCVCEICHGVYSIRDCIIVWYKGQILSSACPKCQETKGILVTRVEGGISIKPVEADRDGGKLVQLAPGNALDVLDKIGPQVVKEER